MDSLGGYSGVVRPKPLTRRELDKMRKIMRHVPRIHRQNDEYHKEEEKEADEQFDKQLDQLIVNNG